MNRLASLVGKCTWRDVAWWIGVPLLVAISIWAPFVTWHVIRHDAEWWRVTLIGNTLFDTYAYLNWMGDVVRGVGIGGHLRWFVWPFRWIAQPLSHIGATLPEQWLVSRWIMTTLMLWVGAWSIRQWSDLNVWSSRLVSACLWVSLVLVFGWRPGVYSWYLPIVFFGMAAARRAFSALESSSFLPAIGWTTLALAASSIYTHFLIFTIVWLASLWLVWIHRRSRVLFSALFIIGSVCALLFGVVAARWLTFTPHGMALLDQLTRSGLAYTHLPFFANLVGVMLGWLAVLAVMSWGESDYREPRFLALTWAWLAIFFSWFMSPFTGIHIQNGHFRAVIVLLSWVSVAAVWSRIRSSRMTSRSSVSERWILGSVLGGATLYILNIIRKPYAFNHDFLDVLHFSSWFVLWLGTLFLLCREHRIWNRTSTVFSWTMCIGATLIGVVSYYVVFQDELRSLQRLVNRQPVINWIQSHVRRDQTMCSNPSDAEFFFAQTGQRAYLYQVMVELPETDASILKRITVLAGAYDAVEAGAGEDLRIISVMAKDITCRQFPFVERVMRALHVSEESIQRATGCPRTVVDEYWAFVSRAYKEKKLDVPTFVEVCPYVIIPETEQRYWHLPSGYTEQRFEEFSVWEYRHS